MTLVAALTIDDTPVLMGDILLTREGADTQAGLPTRVDAGTLMPAEYEIAGVRRKLTVLHDRLVVGWAGDEDGARPVIRELRNLARVSRRLDRDVLFAFLKEGHARGHECQLVGWLVDDRGPLAFGWNSASEEFSSGAAGYTAGTGAPDFMREVRTRHIGAVDSRLTPAQRVIEVALTLAGNALGREVLAGETLEHRYGGALEMAVFTEGRFEVVSNIGFQFWVVHIDLEKDTLSLTPAKTSMTYFHADDCLIVYTVRNEKLGELMAREFHIVTPVDHAGGAVADLSRFRGFVSAQPTRYCNFIAVPVPGFGGLLSTLILPEPNDCMGHEREVSSDGVVQKESLYVTKEFAGLLFDTLAPQVKALREIGKLP